MVNTTKGVVLVKFDRLEYLFTVTFLNFFNSLTLKRIWFHNLYVFNIMNIYSQHNII